MSNSVRWYNKDERVEKIFRKSRDFSTTLLDLGSESRPLENGDIMEIVAAGK